MWEEDDIYEKQFGKCEFMAGEIEALTGNLDSKLYNAGVRY